MFWTKLSNLDYKTNKSVSLICNLIPIILLCALLGFNCSIPALSKVLGVIVTDDQTRAELCESKVMHNLSRGSSLASPSTSLILSISPQTCSWIMRVYSQRHCWAYRVLHQCSTRLLYSITGSLSNLTLWDVYYSCLRETWQQNPIFIVRWFFCKVNLKIWLKLEWGFCFTLSHIIIYKESIFKICWNLIIC